MDKRTLLEKDIRCVFITPAIAKAGWDLKKQVKEEVRFTAGRIWVRGNLTKRGPAKIADYILYYKPNIPIAIIEAKDNTRSLGAGMQQALEYSAILDIPFVYSSNGDGFLEHDNTVSSGQIEQELSLDAFPSPNQLWQRYKAYKGIPDTEEKITTQDYYRGDENKIPHYYQMTAINRVIEAVAKGRKRLLLVMATGTGKTFVAFQVIWRLWKAGKMKRILFLADRDNLLSQTMINDFKPFGDKMTRIVKRTADKAFEVYLSLYQAMTGPEENKKIYKKFSRSFFDLIIIDECHRGSAAEDSEWREILEYFDSAVQLGLTATPKETRYISNIDYFGEPVFIYSLKQGIQDGFLAPYKVIRTAMDKDDGWRPPMGKTDKAGSIIPDRVYDIDDFERELVIDERTQLVAARISEFLKKTDRFAKTIVFCEDIEHAARMRQALVNENPDLVSQYRKYIVQITGDEPDRKTDLYNFISPKETLPVIVTTSRLLNTGVDSRTCKLIVIDKTINSMIEFKQIIGRGTRVAADFNKLFFTIIDFRRATNLFADPDFDGDPVSIYEPHANDPIIREENSDEEEPFTSAETGTDNQADRYQLEAGGAGIIGDHKPDLKRKKIYVDGVAIEIINERVQYIDEHGKLITESIRDYCKKSIRKNYAALDDFLAGWNAADKKRVIIDELEERGICLEALQEEVGKDFDVFDLVCHVAYDRPPMTRKERAERVKKNNYFDKYGDKARAVLAALLDKYADRGIENIEDMEVLKIQPFTAIGSPIEIIRSFGGKDKYKAALKELTEQLYNAA